METSALDARREAPPEMQEFTSGSTRKRSACGKFSRTWFPRNPRRACSAIWRYDELRPLVIESGGLITARKPSGA